MNRIPKIGCLAFLFQSTLLLGQGPGTPAGQNLNYSVKNKILISGIVSETSLNALTVDQTSQVIEYSDGLGRPIQTVGVQASPNKYDVIQAVLYDSYGRSSTAYLPYVSSTQKTGSFISGVTSLPAYANFYNSSTSKIANTSYPFQTTVFENSPLGRPVESGGIGQYWQPNGNTVKYSYGVNASNDVRKFSILPDGSLDLNAVNFYPAGTLTSETQVHISGLKTISFKDSQGKTVSIKQQVSQSQWTESMSVFDDYGNLRFTLSPQAVKSIDAPDGYYVLTQNTTITTPGNYLYAPGVTVTLPVGTDWLPGTTIAPKDVVVNQLVKVDLTNQYQYDNQNRLIAEKGPGTDWVYYIYDQWDRLVLTQTGSQRPLDLWDFVKYDLLNRPILTGQVALAGQTVNSLRLLVEANTVRFEDRGTAILGYTNNAFPQVSDLNAYITATYFDDIRNTPANWGDDIIDALIGTGLNDVFYTENNRGLVAYTKARILGTTKWIGTSHFYDKYKQLVYTVSRYFTDDDINSDYWLRTTMFYDFSGKLVKTIETTNKGELMAQIKNLEYDHAGRLSKVYHTFKTQPKTLLASYEYNELGQAVVKKIHSVDGSNFLQAIDYRYNIQGAITKINLTSDTYGNAKPDYFQSELAYEGSFSSGNLPRYDGLITSVKWKHDNSSKNRYYNFEYDPVGQMSGATYKKENTMFSDIDYYSEKGLTYDFNGNIKSLDRYWGKTQLTQTDQLSYAYSGNQLMRVTDAKADPIGFSDGNTIGDDYQYNEDGNITLDKNKGITAILYNEIGLTKQVTLGNNGYIKYLYSATGEKISRSFYDNNNQLQNQVDYVGSFVYGGSTTQTTLQSITTEEGRMVPVYDNLVGDINIREANSTNAYTADANVNLSTQFINNQTYVVAQCSQSATNVGINSIGGPYSVNPGESYTFMVLGYQSAGTNASLYVASASGTTILWPSNSLPVGSVNENWVSTNAFTVPTGVTSIKIGVRWNGQASGNTFYINQVKLYKNDFEYQYFLSDHVGNVRAVLQTTPVTTTYTATMETENAATESTYFKNINYNAAYLGIFPQGNVTPGGNESLRMNSTYRVGPAKSLEVYPGDVINASVWGNYPTSSGFPQANVNSMISAVVSAFQATGGAVDGINQAFTQFTNAGNPALSVLEPYRGSSIPSAFLNYILFDENYMPLAAESKPIGAANAWNQLSFNVTIEEKGFIYVYLSYDNESANFVYFDDFRISHQESNLIQVNNYYPFGLVAYTWTRTGEQDNKYLYQGKELDAQTGLHDFGSRLYWADLGRWFAVDPAGQYASPYLGMGNSPINGTDPNGEFFLVDDLIVAGVGFVYGAVSYAIKNGKFDKGAVMNGLKQAAIFELGFVSGGGSAVGMEAVGGFLANKAVNIAGSQILPSMGFQTKNFSLSVSPMFSLDRAGASLNFSYSPGDHWQISGGIGMSNSSGPFGDEATSLSLTGAARFHGTEYSQSYLGGGTKNAQWTGAFNWYHRSGGYFRFENDVLAWQRKDRWRTGGAEIGFGKDWALGAQVYTNNPGDRHTKRTRKSDIDDKGESLIWGPNGRSLSNVLSRSNEDGTEYGAWKKGLVLNSPVYIGHREGNQMMKVGVNHPIVQASFQNFIHRYLVSQNYYNLYYNDYGKNHWLYFQYSNQNAFSVYDY